MLEVYLFFAAGVLIVICSAIVFELLSSSVRQVYIKSKEAEKALKREEREREIEKRRFTS